MKCWFNETGHKVGHGADMQSVSAPGLLASLRSDRNNSKPGSQRGDMEMWKEAPSVHFCGLPFDGI